MIRIDISDKLTKTQRWTYIARRFDSLADAESDALAVLCNSMAFLYWTLGDVNWTGLYILRGSDLVLGSFAGKPACFRIPTGKGVCGQAAALSEVQLVPDVEQFPGHIACDNASRSELVMPLFAHGKLWGVLDMDSPVLGRFDAEDAAAAAEVCAVLERVIARLS
ncbi:MAG: GAF domain-containing protein [Pyramidobacter sp.]|nr:GAF domain-containing protein [Pyramidobacter sp.]